MPALSPAYAQRELSLAAAMVGAGTLGLQRATEFAKCKRGGGAWRKAGSSWSIEYLLWLSAVQVTGDRALTSALQLYLYCT